MAYAAHPFAAANQKAAFPLGGRTQTILLCILCQLILSGCPPDSEPGGGDPDPAPGPNSTDFLPQPASVTSGLLEYANTDWQIDVSRNFRFGGLPTEMSFKVQSTLDLSASVDTRTGDDGETILIFRAPYTGNVAWKDAPVSKPEYRCPEYRWSKGFSGTGTFELRQSPGNPNWLRLGTFTLYNHPNTPYTKPSRDYEVRCEGWDSNQQRWVATNETRPSQDFLSSQLLIALAPGDFPRDGAYSSGFRTWNTSIELLGNPLPCAHSCSDDNPCTDNDRCELGVGCVHDLLNGHFDFNPHDCYKNECYDGYPADIPDDSEIPPQSGPPDDCLKDVCSGGSVATVAAPHPEETPPNEPGNCRREECGIYDVIYRIDNTDLPPQDSPNDCVRETCQLGEPISVPDDSETPLPAPDGSPRICRNGEAVLP